MFGLVGWVERSETHYVLRRGASMGFAPLNPSYGYYGCWPPRPTMVAPTTVSVPSETAHDGASIDEAVATAEIDTSHLELDLLVQIARAIGTTLGRINRG